MANNPRKFSEKIALHNHRQAEETARFEQIMKEVSDATARVAPDRGSSEKNTLRISNQTPLGTFRGGSLPNVSAATPTVKTATHIKDSNKPDDVSHTTIPYRESRPRPSQGGPIRRPHDRKLDTSPYSSGAFLSPPPDTSWRRHHSDPALHQSTMQGLSTDRNDAMNSQWQMPPMNGPDHHDHVRPRSSCEIPRVNIYPSAHEPGTIQIPIGNNTGSLPDLTSVHFPSPIHTPLDQDQDQGSSPYSSSPVNTSPSTLSPTSMPQGSRSQGRFQFQSHHSNHLSVPVNSRFLHHNNGIARDKSLPSGLVDATDFSQISGMSGLYHHQQCQPSPPSSTEMYRNVSRPSPQSSPSLGGRHSAPCSPGAPSPLPNDYIFNNHHVAQFQQHFSELSVVDTPTSMPYMEQATNTQMTQSHPQTLPEVSCVGNVDLTVDGGYYSTSPSQLVYSSAPPNMHPTTPNTPTSIPDIILTDFSSGGDDMSRQDLSFTKQFDVDLLEDESLREGLTPLDFTDMQILTEPTLNFISDGVEDHFRLDHRRNS